MSAELGYLHTAEVTSPWGSPLHRPSSAGSTMRAGGRRSDAVLGKQSAWRLVSRSPSPEGSGYSDDANANRSYGSAARPDRQR
jgi:hypothetical protein